LRLERKLGQDGAPPRVPTRGGGGQAVHAQAQRQVVHLAAERGVRGGPAQGAASPRVDSRSNTIRGDRGCGSRRRRHSLCRSVQPCPPRNGSWRQSLSGRDLTISRLPCMIRMVSVSCNLHNGDGGSGRVAGMFWKVSIASRRPQQGGLSVLISTSRLSWCRSSFPSRIWEKKRAKVLSISLSPILLPRGSPTRLGRCCVTHMTKCGFCSRMTFRMALKLFPPARL
jgi:hypothetical protein